MKISIITDGNINLGLGHVYQSITLAKLICGQKNIQADIFFITKSDHKTQNLIRNAGFEVEHITTDEQILERLKQLQPDKIIFDKLDVAPKLAQKIKESIRKKLIIFTNLTEANNYADMTVLADVNYKNIVKKNNNGKVDFLGPKFWLLRPEFYQLKIMNKAKSSELNSLMLMFGAADPCNLTTLTLREIFKLNKKLNVLVVTGTSFPFKQELDALLDQNKNSLCNVKVVSNISNVGEAMFNSDALFTSPGLAFFEALVVGTPVVAFHQNTQQRDEFANIIPTLGVKDLYKISAIIQNKLLLFPDDIRVKEMEIGEGKDEILKEIFQEA